MFFCFSCDVIKQFQLQIQTRKIQVDMRYQSCLFPSHAVFESSKPNMAPQSGFAFTAF
jgi:hypothetical protein